MKKNNMLAAALVFLLITITACHYGYRTRTVRVSNDNTSLKIEYCGHVDFNEDETGIISLDPEGYVKYRNNNKRFIAVCDEDGNITYKIYDGGRRLNYNDGEAQNIMASAVKEIAEHYNR
jgi:hypothetical protein